MEARAQFRQRGVGPLGQQLLQAFFAGSAQEGLAATPVGLRLQRAPLLEVLAHPPHGGHTVAEAGGDLPGAFASP